MISSAPTQVQGAAGAPPVYYDYEEEPRRRPIWPWLLPILLLLATVVVGFLVYQQIQDQLRRPSRSRCRTSRGCARRSRSNQLDVARASSTRSMRGPSTEQPNGFVYDQNPEGGKRIAPETDVVTLFVSTGPPTGRGAGRARATRATTRWRRSRPRS